MSRQLLTCPPTKEGTGKEIRRLHDKMQQHVRALKAMGQEPSVTELKLDATTLFEWQKHTKESKDVPHYRDLLEFLNSYAQASETRTPDTPK